MQCYQHHTKTASPKVEYTNKGANPIMSDPNKVYVNPETETFVVEEEGSERAATPEEIDEAVEQWEADRDAGEQDLKRLDSDD